MGKRNTAPGLSTIMGKYSKNHEGLFSINHPDKPQEPLRKNTASGFWGGKKNARPHAAASPLSSRK